MHLVLDRVVSEIANELSDLDTETAQLYPGALTYKWTAQQVIEHLVLSYRMTSDALQNRLDKGRAVRKKRTLLQWSLQLMILSCGEFPEGVPALEETTPEPEKFAAMSGRQLGGFLREEAEALNTLLDRCRRIFGMEHVAIHPWLGPLRVDQWRRFHSLHGSHHLNQLRSVLAQVSPEPLPVKHTTGSFVKELQMNEPLLKS
jgi:hypothetical protein